MHVYYQYVETICMAISYRSVDWMEIWQHISMGENKHVTCSG